MAVLERPSIDVDEVTPYRRFDRHTRKIVTVVAEVDIHADIADLFRSESR